jgi:aminoglycoside 6'-N-acetyltransferase I
MVQIRHVEPADARVWTKLRSALWPDEPEAELAAEVEAFFADPEGRASSTVQAVLVAVERPGADPVGFVELSRRPYAEGCATSPVGFLEGWYVLPDHRRHGVGRALVRAAQDWARSAGCREFASDALAGNWLGDAAHRAVGFSEVEVIRCYRMDL